MVWSPGDFSLWYFPMKINIRFEGTNHTTNAQTASMICKVIFERLVVVRLLGSWASKPLFVGSNRQFVSPRCSCFLSMSENVIANLQHATFDVWMFPIPIVPHIKKIFSDFALPPTGILNFCPKLPLNTKLNKIECQVKQRRPFFDPSIEDLLQHHFYLLFWPKYRGFTSASHLLSFLDPCIYVVTLYEIVQGDEVYKRREWYRMLKNRGKFSKENCCKNFDKKIEKIFEKKNSSIFFFFSIFHFFSP